MAYDYQKAKSAYEQLSKDEQQQFIDRNRDNANVQQFAKDYAAEMSWKTKQTPSANSTAVTNAWNTKAATTVKTNNTNATKPTAVPEYQWTWGSNKQSSYTNQWEGNYIYNPTSWYYEKSNTSQTSNKNQTSTPVSSMDSTQRAWDNMSYADQQKKLNEIPWLKDALIKKGWNIKTEEVAPTKTETGVETPKTWDGWNYQDNSPERMKQIADNVNSLATTDPWIFNNEDSFRKFFIDWKGRTPEQEAFLMDLYKNMKTYNQLDTYPADKIWNMYAHWEVPDSYLNYLKNSNPDRYNEVMDYKDQSEKGIENENYYNTLLANSWNPDWMKWAKENWFLIDRNFDDIDDRRYHAPTEEEQNLVTEYSTLASEQLADANAYRDLQADLTEQYPDADMSTILLLAWDRGKKIQDRMDTRNVTMTKLKGQIDYLQSERQAQDKAGADTISQLQKAYWMYYDYSPEWMSELAQAKYAATNVTLDQANNWTDTQKQMALQSVLDDYYDKYGSIIQRSEQQVINDVIAYAKNNWVSLSQALEENFLKPLRSKPEFSQLNTLQSDPYTVKSWDITYVYDPVTKTFSPIWWGATWDSLWWWTSSWQLYWFTNYTPITTEQKESVLDNFINKRKEGTDWWQCWEFVNDYLQALWYDRLYDDPIDKKKAVTNSDTATVWSIAVMDSQKYPEYWHVAIVTDVQWDKVKLLESNWNNDKKVHTTRWVNKSDILWYFDPSKEPTNQMTADQNNKYSNKNWWNKDWYFDNLVQEYEAYLSDPSYESKADLQFKLWDISFDDFTKQAQNYARTWMKSKALDSTSSSLEAAINLYEYINWNKSKTIWFNDPKQTWIFDWLWWYIPKLWWDAYDAKNYYDTLMSNLTLDKLIETKKQWATYWAMSEWEWKLLQSAATSLDWGSTWAKFKENLENMIYGMVRAIEEWWWKLPSNYAGSTASKEYLQWQKDWRYDKYKSEWWNKWWNKWWGNSWEPEML